MKTIQPKVSADEPDEVMREVWRIKEELARKYDYDIHRMVAAARENQATSGHRVITLAASPTPSAGS